MKTENIQSEIELIVDFIKTTFKEQGVSNAVIAVSGGIDSAVALTLVSKAISVEHIYPLFLPYDGQSTEKAEEMVKFNQIPEKNVEIENIFFIVDSVRLNLEIAQTDQLRLGNIMARVRMLIIYDWAKNKQGLVIGTENKSEKYLGYYTRYGDEASDLEPIQHLYKTEVWAMAKALDIPEHIIKQAPSAGLWEGQSDEQELGFSYHDADKVIGSYLKHDGKQAVVKKDCVKQGFSEELVEKIITRIKSVEFKQKVPYKL